MHAAALHFHSLRGTYVACDVDPAAVAEALRGAAALGFRGLNVTLPHKEAVAALADHLAPSARRAGAVNTVLFDDGVVVGHNTDGDGFLRALESDSGWEPGGRSALLLGAGGSARAVGSALSDAGARRVRIAGRTPGRAAALARSLGPAAEGGSLETAWLRDADLLVNCTPVGMWPAVNGSPLAQGQMDELPDGCLVVDLVYVPLETVLLRQARRRGLRAQGGIGMLAWQGALSWGVWLGRDGPVDVMRQAAIAALAERMDA
jgi:shikimate dehydrogenase